MAASSRYGFFLRRYSSYEIMFNGTSVLTTLANSPGLANSSLNDLRSSFAGKPLVVVGLGIKWGSSYYDKNKVATLQLCHGNRCVIIQPLHLGHVPHCLKTFLADQSIHFVCVGIIEDVTEFARDNGFQCQPVIELGPLAATAYENQQLNSSGLVKLARAVAGLVIDKPASITHSFWSVDLTSDEIKLATDAYASYAIGNKLLGGN